MPRGQPLMIRLWWLGKFGACIPGSHRTVAIRETVIDRIQPTGHCTETRLRHSYSPSVKKASMLVLELRHEENTSDLTHIYRSMELFSRNVGCGRHLGSLPFSRFPVSPSKEVYNHLEIPVAQETPPDHLSLVVSRAYACGHKGLYIFKLRF